MIVTSLSQRLSDLDVSSVTNMYQAFSNTRASNIGTCPIYGMC